MTYEIINERDIEIREEEILELRALKKKVRKDFYRDNALTVENLDILFDQIELIDKDIINLEREIEDMSLEFNRNNKRFQ